MFELMWFVKFRIKLPHGVPNRRAWNRVISGVEPPFCHYCEREFNERLPPTIDHILTRAAGAKRQKMRYGQKVTVLACSPCNHARGNAPYAPYFKAAKEAVQRAQESGRSYARPKFPHLQNIY